MTICVAGSIRLGSGVIDNYVLDGITSDRIDNAQGLPIEVD